MRISSQIARIVLVIVSWASIAVVDFAFAAPPNYLVTDLGTLGGEGSNGWALNNAGEVVGSSAIDDDDTHAFLYKDGVMHDLGTLGGSRSTANDINDSGQIAGTSQSNAFLYSNGVMEDIGNLGGPIAVSKGWGLNDIGEVVGQSRAPDDPSEAFLYSEGLMQGIDTLPDDGCLQSIGYDINNLGHVTGEVNVLIPGEGRCIYHTFLYSEGEMQDIGVLLPDFATRGYAINDFDQIVIHAIPRSPGQAHGFLYTDGSVEEIGSDLIPWGINNSGWVVGQTTSGGSDARAFLYVEGNIFNLNYLVTNLSGWEYLQSARDINDSGQITGYGRTASGETHAFLLTPIIDVLIDIKPGDTPNSINPSGKQNIPVAILTTDSFDATQVNWETVLFGPDRATESHGRAHIEDVDADGDMDLLLHFKTQETGIVCGDTEAILIGETFGGEPFTGTDTVAPKPCPDSDIGHIWRVNYTQAALNSMNNKVETHVLLTDSSFASSGANYWNEVYPVSETQTLMETSAPGGGSPSITFVGQATSLTSSGNPMSGEPIDDDLDNWAARFPENVVNWELRDLNPLKSYDLVFYDLDSLTASITLTTEVDSDGDGVLDQTDTIAWGVGDDFSLFQGVSPNAGGVIRGRWTGSSSSFVDVAGFQVAESSN